MKTIDKDVLAGYNNGIAKKESIMGLSTHLLTISRKKAT